MTRSGAGEQVAAPPPLAKRPRQVLTWLMPVALVGLAFLARGLAHGAWTAFTQYRTPFALSTPQARATEPLVGQVVIVLVDGLAYHASRSMPYLNELRSWGSDLECRAGLPSLSLPGRAALVSGAWQEVHGQATNFNPQPLRVEHLFLTAKRRVRRTALAAGSNPHLLFAPHADERVIYPRLEAGESRSLDRLKAELLWMGEATRGLLREKRPHLFMMDYTIADEAGHGWGAASPQYAAAARAVDDEIRKLAREMDFGRAVLMITSDHGHTPSGGHGGPEESVMKVPLVLVGGPVRPDMQGQCDQTDLAPTVAALLGIAIPASNQGRPLLDFLVLQSAQRQAILRALHEQRHNFVEHYVAWVLGRPTPPGAGSRRASAVAPERLEAGLQELERWADEAKQERMAAEARARTAVPLALVGVLIVVALSLRAAGVVSGPGLALSLLGALAAAVLYFMLFRGAGLDYSFSAVNRDDALGSFFRADMILAVASCAAAVALAGAWMGRRMEGVRFADLARLSFLVTGAFCALLLLKMAIVYWRHGIFLRWQMPDQFWAFGFYLDTLAVVALGFASPLMPLAAWAGASLGRAWAAGGLTRRFARGER